MSNDPYISVEDIKFFASFASLFSGGVVREPVGTVHMSSYIRSRACQKFFFSTVPELEILTVIHPNLVLLNPL